ncbi:MAG: hypothetical protein ACREV2_12070 [Burkholderiales bacterium]
MLRFSRFVIHPGTNRYPLANRVEAVPLAELVHGAKSVFPSR